MCNWSGWKHSCNTAKCFEHIGFVELKLHCPYTKPSEYSTIFDQDRRSVEGSGPGRKFHDNVQVWHADDPQHGSSGGINYQSHSYVLYSKVKENLDISTTKVYELQLAEFKENKANGVTS
jgi:hypothetical protein